MKKTSRIRQITKETHRELSKDLPLIDLQGKDEKERIELIFKGIGDCIEKIPLKIINRVENDKVRCFLSLYEFSEDSSFPVTVYYFPEPDFIKLEIDYGKTYLEKENEMRQMLDMMNSRCFAWHYDLHLDTGIVSIESGIIVADHFDSKEMFILLRYMLGNVSIYFPLLKELLESDDAPATILKKHDKKIDAFKKENPELFG